MSLVLLPSPSLFLFFFFNATAPTEIYTLSLHDALPICCDVQRHLVASMRNTAGWRPSVVLQHSQNSEVLDRKSTRLNSSHVSISYAVFCLKKKKKKTDTQYFIIH